MSFAEIEVEVEDPAWAAALPAAETVARDAARAALSRLEVDENAALALLLTGDDAVAELNGRFRGKPKPTNVLSFPAPPSAAPHLGDVALAYGVCAAEADAQGKPLADHLAHLVVHGVLHLLGYDHETDADAEVMEAMERETLGGVLGVPDPYLPRDPYG